MTFWFGGLVVRVDQLVGIALAEPINEETFWSCGSRLDAGRPAEAVKRCGIPSLTSDTGRAAADGWTSLKQKRKRFGNFFF
ncbi:hypothetical protein BJ742DRAFT_787254 [Cladochytrium replicatum]|nr:hypothetical protein BJ742DRAFT_787254 [Cladochytrium replicatum]